MHGDAGNRGRGMRGHRLSHCLDPARRNDYLLVECAEPIVYQLGCGTDN
jgi:hypothetical protein